VAGGRGSRNRSRPRARAATAAVRFPRSAFPSAGDRAKTGRAGKSGDRLELSGILPSGRSILVGFLILALGVGLYAIARGTSAFAVRTVTVAGAPPEVAAEVRKALDPAVGESLLAIDLDDLSRRVQQVPMVATASFDRGFPHTLRIAVAPQVPVAVLRQGASSWLVAAGGRVVAELDRGAHSALPRVWLTRTVQVVVGEKIRGLPLQASTVVAPLVERPLPFRVTASVATGTELTLKLRSGLELRLGDATDLLLKLEVARRVLSSLAGAQGYLDVSVPERPVAGDDLNSQVEVETSTSTQP
jgi:cell division protein FtsQ